MIRAITLCVFTSYYLLATVSPALGAGNRHRPASRSATATEVFRLRVVGPVEARATFWVAYGPLAGRFGIVQLRKEADGLYVANASLPAAGRTVLTYLEGTGAVQTPMGNAPGNPVTTIKTVGPLAVGSHNLPVVQWSQPAG